VKLNIEQMGPTDGAPTVVCIHGGIIDTMASYYFTLAAPLAEAGLRVVMYDLRGHGRSGRPQSGYMLDDFVDDLAALLDEIGVSTPVYLVGNSMGGTIAYSFAARHPTRVAGMVIIESEPPGPDWAERMAEYLESATHELSRLELQAWVGYEHGLHALRVAKRAAKLLRSTTVARDIPASRLPTIEQIGSIDCPVLVLYGAESELAAQAARLSALLPQSTIQLVPGQGHFMLIQVPETVRGILLEWFDDRRRAA
jgi:pimeloyl-ACP methyl ester carboxylesterase